MCTRSFPRSGRGTAICVIPPCVGIERRRAFLCPDCDAAIEMEISEDGTSLHRAGRPVLLSEGAQEKPRLSSLRHAAMVCGQSGQTDANGSRSANTDGYTATALQAHLKRTKNERVLRPARADRAGSGRLLSGPRRTAALSTEYLHQEKAARKDRRLPLR